jgi:hypothetical protein
LAAAWTAPQPEDPSGKDNISPGVSACAACHSGTDARPANLFVAQYRSNDYIKLNESVTWLSEDTHSQAFKALEGPLGRRMARILKVDVTRAPQCLTCHAVDLTPAAPSAEKRFFLNQGVNCAGCHGLAETWQVRHYKESPDGTAIPWRVMTPEEKAQAGMADLRNPVVKAKLCVSCHVGNPEQGKVLTHAMYAAGHPPLPPFELATYLEGEPRHWGTPAELPYFKTVPTGKTWSLYRFHAAEKEVHEARHLAAGAVAALVAEARQLQANAATVLTTDGGVIDYARFDCYACHHELITPSARQDRGAPPGALGRPSLRWAPAVLAGVVAEHAAGLGVERLKSRAREFAGKWTALTRAVTAEPFGDPQLVFDASREVIVQGEALLKELAEYPDPLYSLAEAHRLRTLIATAATTGRTAADPEAAFCLTWAYTTLSRALKVPLPDDQLQKLSRTVPLTVRAAPYCRSEDGKAVPISPRFVDRMKAIAGYESDSFLDPFRRISTSR